MRVRYTGKQVDTYHVDMYIRITYLPITLFPCLPFTCLLAYLPTCFPAYLL